MRGLSICGSVVAASLAVASAAIAQAPQPPVAMPSPLPILPPDNWWNVDISGAPVDPGSAGFITHIGGSGRSVHPDFGGSDGTADGIYGMVYAVVPGTTPLETVDFSTYGYPDESDVGAPGRPPGYPIPVNARMNPKWIEGGQPASCPLDTCDGDRHMLLVDQDNRVLFELYQVFWNGSTWQAGSGAVFPLDSNLRRPDGWTSADAAGLAILPGLVRYDEVFGANPIRHAFRVTVQNSNGYVFPGSHNAGSTAGALPMGARLRLKASTAMPSDPQLQKIFQALKTYGLIVADNGTDMYVTGAYDPRWDTTNNLVGPRWGTITAADFEVVQLGWKPATSPPVVDLHFYTLTPCRLVDTRGTAGVPYGGPAIPPSQERIFTAIGHCGIPATAKAISINAAVVVAPGPGNLTFYPGDLSAPASSNINFTGGQTRANSAVVKLAGSGSGTFAIRQFTSPAGSTQVIVDVNGYFQ
jgi:hypothetical protein